MMTKFVKEVSRMKSLLVKLGVILIGLAILLAIVFMVSGCAVSLSPQFDTDVKKDLGISPILSYRADWIKGVYGFPSFTESLASKIQIIRGALVVDDEKVSLVRFDKQINRYDFILELLHTNIKDVRVFRYGAARRLGLRTKEAPFTFEIIKGGGIDKIKTYEFAILIADKVGKDSSEFSKELEKEINRKKEYEDGIK